MRLRFASRADEVPPVTARVEAFCRQAGFAPQQVFEIATCAAEGVNNAIEHAYGGDAGGVVELRCTLRAGTLILEIADRGSRMADDEPPPAPLDGETGRGWTILRAWSDRVQYLHRGDRNVLRIERALPRHPQPS